MKVYDIVNEYKLKKESSLQCAVETFKTREEAEECMRTCKANWENRVYYDYYYIEERED